MQCDLLESDGMIFWRAWGNSKKQTDAFATGRTESGQTKNICDGSLKHGNRAGIAQIVQVNSNLPTVANKAVGFAAGKGAAPCRVWQCKFSLFLRWTVGW